MRIVRQDVTVLTSLEVSSDWNYWILGYQKFWKTARWIFLIFCSEVSSEVPEKNDRARFCRKNLDHSKKIMDHSKMDTKVVQSRTWVGSHIIFSKMAPTIFLMLGIKLVLDKGKKVTEPDFSRKLRFSGFWAKRSQNGPKWPKMTQIDVFLENGSKDFRNF